MIKNEKINENYQSKKENNCFVFEENKKIKKTKKRTRKKEIQEKNDLIKEKM